MDSAGMLAYLRTLLDETSEGFWDDDVDCYPALALGQLEVIKLLAPKRSKVVADLASPVTQSSLSFGITTGFSLPANFYLIWSLKAAPNTGTQQKPCIRREGDEYYYQDNPYLSSEDDSMYYKVYGNKLYFDIEFVSGAITLDYVAKPDDISSSTEPAIDSIAHNAVVYYAYGFLLQKAKLDSGNAFQLFYKAIESL